MMLQKKKKKNQDWLQIPNQPYRILKIGSSDKKMHYLI